MYGLSDTEDLSFLAGAEVIQVCIGRHQAAIHFFPEDVAIFVETDMAFRSPGGESMRYQAIPESASMLVSLLNAFVTRASVKAPGTLSLEFSTGGVLEIEDTSDRYESFRIKNGDRLIVV